MYQQDLAFDKQQGLIYHNIQPTKRCDLVSWVHNMENLHNLSVIPLNGIRFRNQLETMH